MMEKGEKLAYFLMVAIGSIIAISFCFIPLGDNIWPLYSLLDSSSGDLALRVIDIICLSSATALTIVWMAFYFGRYGFDSSWKWLIAASVMMSLSTVLFGLSFWGYFQYWAFLGISTLLYWISCFNLRPNGARGKKDC